MKGSPSYDHSYDFINLTALNISFSLRAIKKLPPQALR
jgi:hypothetical protein